MGCPHLMLRTRKSLRRTGMKFQGLERGAMGVPSPVAGEGGWVPMKPREAQ